MTDNKAYIASINLYSRNFGDEVLIVDTESGLFFSLRGCAVDIWSLIESGVTVNDIIAELGRRYDGTLGDVVAATRRCLDDLLANNLLRETEVAGGEIAVPAGTAPKQTLAAPLVERFTDMQDLLLLDPIHDTSDMGWPHRGSPTGDTSGSR
jgi:hypothetical protein